MKRRIGLLAAAALVAGLGFTTQPASAVTDVCAGLGNATTGAGLGAFNPTVAPTSTTFGFTLNGVCASGATLSATGTLRGYCGQSGGQGITTTGGLTFSYTSAGTLLVVTGEVVGVVNALEDPFDTGSCLNGTAQSFLVNGGGVGNTALTGCVQVLENTLTVLSAHVLVCI